MDDINYEYSLAYCGGTIRMWKRSWFKKNSSKPAQIKIRWADPICDSRAYKFFIELWVGGKLMQQDRIKREAYDALVSGKLSEAEMPGGITLSTIAEHEPVKMISISLIKD